MTPVDNDKLDLLLRSAAEQSKAVFIKGSLNTFDRILALCEMLLRQPVPNSPTYNNISEEGRKQFSNFPAPQSLKNDYREVIRPWKRAYDELLANGKQKQRPHPSAFINEKADLSALVKGLYDQIGHMEREINRLRNVIYVTCPISDAERKSEASYDPNDVSLMKEWFERLGAPDSIIAISDTGLELTGLARPHRSIMNIRQVEALRKILMV
ncbi:hypothetical protein ACU8OG_20995 [Rhizobium leguminosarum]